MLATHVRLAWGADAQPTLAADIAAARDVLAGLHRG
jgi:hypothetical protein